MGAKYKFRTRPYKHQMTAIRKMASLDYQGALLMDPRTGKTKTAIDCFGILHLKHGLRKVLIVCPSRVIGVWHEEIHRHSPHLCEVIIWDREGRKRALPQSVGRFDMQIVVVNYEAFATPGKKLPSGRRSKTNGRFKIRGDIAKWIGEDKAMCILDESHKIKNPSGKAATMIVSMRPLFKWRFLLTGTVVTKAKKAHDVYMQWKFLNPSRFEDTPTLETFKSTYGRWVDTGEGYTKWIGPRNMPEFHRRIHLDAFAVHREDCFDLPPREDIVELIDLKVRAARIYDEMAEMMVARIINEEITEASIALVQGLRLAQITGGHATTPPPEKKTYRIGTEKLLALKAHLEDAQDRSEKLVVAARFRAELDEIAALCASLKLPCWQMRGGVKRADTDRYIREFRKHDDAGVFLMQPSSGSLGIDLSTAAKMIWYSLTTSYVDYTQACDRIALSRKSTTFIYLLVPRTIDQVMYDTLRQDGDVAKAITSTPEKLLRSETARKALLANKDKWRGEEKSDRG